MTQLETPRPVPNRVVVTGGAGYIGSHVCVDLLVADRNVLVIDNFENSSPKALKRVEKISGKRLIVLTASLGDKADEARIIDAVTHFNPDSAIHLAGLKAVEESVIDPLRYYETNLNATFALLKAMRAAQVNVLAFSSSATVYGNLNDAPVNEKGKTGPTNPYGRSKLIIEELLKDHVAVNPGWRVVNLRYFNPVGAHSSGLIGEAPLGRSNNLFPYISQVAIGRCEKLSVFGGDYLTKDGTGVRDYIHVSDLARGHLLALDYLYGKASGGVETINLGAGKGYSVLEAVSAFKRASNRNIPYELCPRRAGDIAQIYADAGLAKRLLGWEATKTIDDICADTWAWQTQNPNGYDGS